MSSFGLDIGSKSIKIVQLEKSGKTIRLVSAGIASAPPHGMSSDSENDLVKVSEIIKKLVQDAKVNTRQVIFALPENLVYTRLVSFPPLSDEEVSSAVEWQAEGYIPIPKKDAVISWDIVARTDKGVEVLLVATPRLLVNKYMKVVEDAGLTTVAVETELLSLVRSLSSPNKTVMVVDFGATSTDVAVAVNRQLMFARSIQSGGEALTRAVAAGIGVEAGQAEEYKKTYGLTSSLEGKVKQALSPILMTVLEELKKARGFWQEGHSDLPIELGVLAGGTAGLPEIIPSITSALGFEMSIGSPFANITIDPRVAKSIAPYSPLYSIAVGLALREIQQD